MSPDPSTGGAFARLGRYTIAAEPAPRPWLRVTDPDLGRDVAARVIGPEAAAAGRVAFVREARITGQLAHPNIAGLHELGATSDGRLYFTAPRVDGEHLGALLDSGSRTLPDLLQVFLKVCDAIAFAHDRGVVHRGIAPDRIVVGAFGEVRLGGWDRAELVDGSAVRLDSGGRIATIVGGDLADPGSRPLDDGAAAYAAPEQRAPDAPADPRADVYSLGALLCHIAGGAPPPAPASGSLPAELEVVVRTAMARDPARRYRSASELRADVEAFLDGRPLRAARYSLLQRLAKLVARHRAVSAALLLGLVAALAAGGFAYLQQRQLLRLRAAELSAARRRAQSRALIEMGRQAIEQMRALRRMPDPGADRLAALARVARSRFAAALERDDAPEARLGLARTALLLGDEAAGRAALDRLIAAAPTFAAAHLERVRLDLAEYVALREQRSPALMTTPACRALRQRIDADLAVVSRHAPPGEQRYGRALLALADGDLRRAADLLAEVLRVAPADPHAHRYLGMAANGLGELARADAALGRALTFDSLLVDALVARSDVRRSMLRMRAALADADRALALAPDLWTAHAARASTLLALGRATEALVSADRAVALDPAGVLSRRTRVQVYGALGRHAEAAADLEEALRRRPDDARLYALRAGRQMLRGAFEDALADLDRAIALQPRDRTYLLTRARLHATREDEAAAEADIERAERAGHGDDAAALRAFLLLRRGALDQALAYLRKAGGVQARLTAASIQLERRALREVLAETDRALAIEPTNLNARTLRAEALQRLGRRGEARALIQQILATHPGHPLANTAHATQLEADGKLREALAALDRAVRSRGLDARPLIARARLHVALGQPRRARDDCDRLLRADTAAWLPPGTRAWAHYIRGGARLWLGDAKGARADADRAIAIAPSSGLAYSLRATLVARDDPGAALPDHDIAVARSPGEWSVWRARGMLRHQLGQLAGARDDLMRSLASNPHDLPARLTLSRIRIGLGEPAAAIEAELDRAIAIPGPADPKVRAEAYGLRGYQRFGQRKYTLALDDLHRAVALLPDNAELLCARARVRTALGDSRQAIADWRRALVLRPDDWVACRDVGAALWRTGRRQEARDHMRRALRLAPASARPSLEASLRTMGQ